MRVSNENGYHAIIDFSTTSLFNRHEQYLGFYNNESKKVECNSLSLFDIENLATLVPMIQSELNK